jgi:hypothetical protein
VFLKSGSVIRRLASLHGLPLGAVRPLRRYYQDAMTSCRPSCLASLPSLGSTSVALVGFAPRRTSAPPRPGVVRPVSPAGKPPRKRQEIPSSWGTSKLSVCTCSVDSGRTTAPDHYGAAAWPLVFQQQRLPRKVFRSSIAWLSDWLSTLRSRSCLRPTQDSLPAAGQALPDGLSTRKVPMKGFRVASYISSPFPSFAWHNEIDLGVEQNDYETSVVNTDAQPNRH